MSGGSVNLFKPDIVTKLELTTIASRIGEIEKKTLGEIRVTISRRRLWKERKLSLHEIAMQHFFAQGMNKTKAKTGVLLFINVKERAFHIIADEGIHAKVSQEFWDNLAATMSQHFKQQKFCDGICTVLSDIGVVLEKEFPAIGGDTNELSNDVIIS